MIIDKGEDKEGVFYKASTIERYAQTLDNYASSDWGNRFYSTEFLEGFCKRRNEIHATVAKSSSTLFLATTLLAFFDSVSGSITIWGITFSVPKIGALALCVYISIGLWVTISQFYNQIIIDRLLSRLGERIGAFAFELALLNHTAQNLWVSALAPRYHGLKSGVGHIRTYSLISLLYVPIIFLVIFYPISIVTWVCTKYLAEDNSLIYLILISISGFFFLFGFITILAFSIRYKFRPAELSEPTTPYIPPDFLEMGTPHPERREEKDEETT